MKAVQICLFAALLPGAAVHLAAEDQEWKTYQLRQEYRPALRFTGKVDYSNTLTVSFEEKGRLAYVAPVGMYAESAIFDLDGKVIQKGSLLAKQDTEIPENDLKLAELKQKEAEITLAEKEQTYRRDKTLYEKKAVSTKQFLESQLIYETALFDKQKAKLEVERCKRVLAACYYYAPFNGIVVEVYQLAGAAVDVAHRVLKLSAVSPIKVTIPLPEDVTQELDQTTQVLIYPVDSLTPVPGWFDNRGLKTSKLECFVDNPRLPVSELTEEEKKLPVIDNLSIISTEKLQRTPSLFWIEQNALKKDENGCFVWKLKNVKATDLKTRLKRVNTIEKVRVTIRNLEIFRGVYCFRAIEKNPELNVDDILVGNVPDSVKDGDKVVYQTLRRLFRPGEQVQVVLSPLKEETSSGFFIPLAALRRNPESDAFYVIVLENGKTRRLPVAFHLKQKEYVKVASKALKDGMTLIYGDKMEKLKDGAEISIGTSQKETKKTISAADK